MTTHEQVGPDCAQKSATEDAESSPLAFAQRVLAETPLYVDHLCRLMKTSSDHFRCGNDRQAMATFAQLASDLEQFSQLTKLLYSNLGAEDPTDLERFWFELRSALRQLQEAFDAQDYVAMADNLGHRLPTQLATWGPIQEELARVA